MTAQLGWLLALASLALCLFLWFRDVRRIMREQKSIVDSAAGQLNVCRKRAAQETETSTAAAVLERSENIYRQAVESYDRMLSKPWICLPAVLMGFRLI